MYSVSYLHHSGFLVETENHYLLFDYYTQNGRHTLGDLKQYGDKPWIVFVSHGHHDHFDEEIFSFRGKLSSLGYVVSWDAFASAKEGGDMMIVKPHENYSFMGANIITLKSNDEGVAFLVSIDGIVLYHGGDLNWWHWNGESAAFNEDIAKQYCSEIDSLINEKIDVAMIPVDKRLEDKYIWGLDYFMNKVGAKHVLPMHFWRNFQISAMLQEDLRTKEYADKLVPVSKENEKFQFS